jgi:aldehyde:ferredoxin oxidoreductase
VKGFYKRILLVDLDSLTFNIEPLSDDLLSKWLGGKGLATKLLMDLNPAGVDPMAPENCLIFATGPFCGTSLWGGSRYGVFTKSPLTGRYCESYSGGKTPEAIDAAGFDAIILRGKAETPTTLTVHPNGCDFHYATDMWGRDSFESEDIALERFVLPDQPAAKKGAVVIGPAAERGVRFGIISNDYWRCAGRSGAGTVMASKKVKAVVFQGDRKRAPFDAEAASAFARGFMQKNRENPQVKAYKAYGTTMMVAIMNTAGAFPARYWTQGACDHWEKISGETYHREHDIRPHACPKCFMACGRLSTLKSGRHEGLRLEGPEYETIYAFGGLCMIEEMEEIAYLNDLCDRLGMDTITTGNLCALAIEAARRGRIELDIEYGNARAIAKLIEQIAHREGLGTVLADGIVPAAKAWGMEDLAVHVKGMEPAGYDPRVLKGIGLAYAISDRGACHLRTTFYKPELSGMIPADAVEGKAALLIDFEDRLTIFDTLVLCRFYRDMYDWQTLSQAMTSMLGPGCSVEELRATAGRIRDLVRKFNIREGLTSDEDRLPRRLLEEVLPGGHALKPEEMERMLADYYALRGWSGSGVPA